MFKNTYIPIILCLLQCGEVTGLEDRNFKKDMRAFVQNISAYSRNYNPNFLIIPQNGQELLTTSGESDGAIDTNYISSINAVGREDLFFGYEKDDSATSKDDSDYLCEFLKKGKENNIIVLVTDYCSLKANIDSSYSKNTSNGFISFAADHRELDNIPAYPLQPYNINSNSIDKISKVKNFLYLITPSSTENKNSFISKLSETNYDLLIIDYFFNDDYLNSADIAVLKKKKNGSSRLVVAYISIGEAEDYRYYWKDNWDTGSPDFLYKENPDWQGNYKVKYWDTKWQQIIYGNDSSYIKKIVDSGFDGAYLDIIDAFEYFENISD